MFFISKKHKGAALIFIVLVGIIVLSILSATAVNIGWQTKRAEAWQTDSTWKMRLNVLARSGATAVAEAVSDDIGAFGDLAIINNTGVESTSVDIYEEPEKTSVKFKVKGNANNFIVTSTVSGNRNNETKTQKVTLSAVKSGDVYVYTWADN